MSNNTLFIENTIRGNFLFCIFILQIQSNLNGSNTFGAVKICSRQGYFELMSVNHSARSEGIIKIYF